MAFLLHQLLSESAARYPDKEAVVFKDDAVSYAELEDESNRLAYALSETGIKKGGPVGIYLNRSIASITALFGILKAGAAYVPIDPFCPPGRLHYILNKCGITCLITSQEKLKALEGQSPEHSSLECALVLGGLTADSGLMASVKALDWQRIRASARKDPPCMNAVDTDLAYILFTSGSTGNPKGVMLSHLNALTFVTSAHDLFQVVADDRFSNICPLHFDMSVFDLFVALKAGATVVVIPESTTMFPVKLAEAIAKNDISVWNSVPSALSLLATYKDLARHDLSSLRLVCFAGELFPMKYLKRLMEVIPAARFCNMYGQTEANSSLYYWVERSSCDGKTVLPIGRPMPNFDVFALDEDGEPVTESEKEGELYVRASTVASGYWNEEGKTENVFVRNPLRPELNERVYRTGDLVHLDFDGNYVFLGRKDHMIKSRGYRIEIGEIEAVLSGHPEIKNAIAIPIPDELIGNRICVVIVPCSPGKIGKNDIVRYCSRQLPKYMVPEIIEFRDSLPATSSGKVDRQKVSAMVKAPAAAERSKTCKS